MSRIISGLSADECVKIGGFYLENADCEMDSKDLLSSMLPSAEECQFKPRSPECQIKERMERYGVGALSDAEVLSVILGENRTEASSRILKTYGLGDLRRLTPKQLQSVKGVGPSKAARIPALFELKKRIALSEHAGVSVKSARDVYEYVHPLVEYEEKENIVVLYLDTKNRVIKHEIVSVGTLNASLIHPREVFKTAIKDNTCAIIMAHNHPSGDPTPSKDDYEITKSIHSAGELLDIPVIDHVVIGKDNYYSFKERGQL